LKVTGNCSFAGAVKRLSNILSEEMTQLVMEDVDTQTEDDLGIVLRVLCNGQRFYCKAYERMKKKICYVVLLEHEEYRMGIVESFVLHKTRNVVFAVVTPLVPTPVQNEDMGCHLCKVELLQNTIVVTVEKLIEKMFFITIDSACSEKYVVRTPNMLGYAVLK